MNTSTTDNDISTHDDVPSKRQKPNTCTRINADSAEIAIDEAGDVGLETKNETLAHEIEDCLSICGFALKKLPEDESWDQIRRDLLDAGNQRLRKSFKVVVLGASGVGKSTVLNALLSEGNLLPCGATGDACTSVPIEIHHNDNSDSIDVKAEIQYVTEAAWRKVIAQAKAETDCDEDDQSDRGQSALKRVGLVYPSLEDYEFLEKSVDEILATNVSKELLGKCNRLQAYNRVEFYRDFKQQIGSIKRPGFATWPLIDHVRLYVRHPLLEKGLVLVDIPGMFETNEARVENAANYLRKCSAVLIMTHAARSNSDAAQESLASRALQQIQYDQRLDCVLYVCTKCDDLDLEDTLEDLDVPELKPYQDELETARQKKEKLSKTDDALKLQLQQQNDIVKYRTMDISRWKRAQSKAAADWDSFRPPGERLANGTILKADASDEGWDEDDVDEKVESLKEEKKSAASLFKGLHAQLSSNESQMQDVQANIEEIELHMKRVVFNTRNDLIKTQQAKRYISAVKKFERESSKAVRDVIELADDDITQGPDFDRVKEKVFCVSALTYSRISKLKKYTTKEGTEAMRDDVTNVGFLKDVQDTEIPALAQRLKHLTLTERYHRLRTVHLKLQIALGSLQSRLTPSVQHKEVDVEAATQATKDFVDQVSQFREGFGRFSATDTAIKDVYQRLFTQMIPLIKTLVIKEGVRKIKPHSQHPSTGGSKKALFPVEYKAAVHGSRNGFYVGKRKLSDGNALRINFNEQIAAEIKQCTHKLIQQVLVSQNGGIKSALSDLEQRLQTIMDKLDNEFRLKAMTVGVDLHRVVLIEENLQLRKRDLHQTFVNVLNNISKAHIAAARYLERDVKSGLRSAYARAYLESGTGARAAMSAEICQALNKDDVVKNAMNMLDSRTSTKLSRILEKLASKLEIMSDSIVADYTECMEHRTQKVESTGDPNLDEIRNHMIAMGINDTEAPAFDDEEEVPVETGSAVTDLEHVIGELAREADEADDEKVKAEAGDDEVTNEEVKNEEMTDEETADAANE